MFHQVMSSRAPQALVARLVAEDMKVFEFPLITTNRAPERWEVPPPRGRGIYVKISLYVKI